jgi:hypothetical protein
MAANKSLQDFSDKMLALHDLYSHIDYDYKFHLNNNVVGGGSKVTHVSVYLHGTETEIGKVEVSTGHLWGRIDLLKPEKLKDLKEVDDTSRFGKLNDSENS